LQHVHWPEAHQKALRITKGLPSFIPKVEYGLFLLEGELIVDATLVISVTWQENNTAFAIH
jgi:hypothetical protein